ncbi:MAG: SMI1/KNR4 family protein [Bacteroidia bacterium]|nr:SMI1/KNR4 family protein [Bacteroidia bacterium]
MHPDSYEFGSVEDGVSLKWIKMAEQRLGVTFPDSYKWWLQNYRGGEIFGDEVYSVYGLPFDQVVGGDIVYVNELARKNGELQPTQLLILENDQGNGYYLDLKKMNSDGECPVFERLSGALYAANFLEFIQKYIRN